ncbi:MAG: YicC family protein [Lentisphaerales bacterium]|nr:YicC family protein [Lentisphaerales bacterium]
MKSMTGFGRGEAAVNGYQISVDISSVNRKQLDIRLSPPKEAIFLDAVVRSVVPGFLARGSVNVQMKLNFSSTFNGVKFNDDTIAAYMKHLQELNDSLNLTNTVSLSDILQLPGAVDELEPTVDVDEVSKAAEEALEMALKNLVESRSNEGLHLKEDLTGRCQYMADALVKLNSASKASEGQLKEKILTRINDAGLELELNDDRLYQEVVFYADRSDITEELVRLDGHVKSFEQMLEKTDPAGREMDFLMQEMNREVNTTASKSSDSEILRLVVSMKAEIERCREQVQNVE